MQPNNSAHPADRAGPRPRLTAKLIPLGVLAAILGVIGWSAWPLVRPAREVGVVQAVFDRSEQAPAEPDDSRSSRAGPTVQAPGWLEAEPYFTACTALADGVVESIEVLEGDYVERGQLVARLVAEDSEIRLRLAEADLADARAALDIARAEREAAQRAWDEPVELDRAVASSQAALAESVGELERLPSLIESARATLRRLEEETARVQRSTAQGAANEFSLIVARQREAAQRAEVAALEARRPVLEAQVDRLESELRAAERHLELRIEDRRRLDAATAAVATAEAAVSRAEAARDEAALELERMTIHAPISGYVQRRLKVPGDKIIRAMDNPHSAHLVHLYDPSRLQVRVDVPLADASHVFVGQRCEVIVEVLPDRVFKGEVLRTTHEADLQKNTLQMKVKVIDPDPILRPEMLTRVKFLPRGSGHGTAEVSAGTERGVGRVLVPTDAVDGDDERAQIWLVTERRNGRGVLRPRPVNIISREDGWLTVSGEVRPGDLIATGLTHPKSGERVVITSGSPAGEPEVGSNPS